MTASKGFQFRAYLLIQCFIDTHGGAVAVVAAYLYGRNWCRADIDYHYWIASMMLKAPCASSDLVHRNLFIKKFSHSSHLPSWDAGNSNERESREWRTDTWDETNEGTEEANAYQLTLCGFNFIFLLLLVDAWHVQRLWRHDEAIKNDSKCVNDDGSVIDGTKLKIDGNFVFTILSTPNSETSVWIV